MFHAVAFCGEGRRLLGGGGWAACGQDSCHGSPVVHGCERRLTRKIVTWWSEGKARGGGSAWRFGPKSLSGPRCRQDPVRAAREAGDTGFDVLIACAFNYEPHTADPNKIDRVPPLKARMNVDLHMADDLKNTGNGNPFVCTDRWHPGSKRADRRSSRRCSRCR